MIELKQMHGRDNEGTRHVFETDIVYEVTDAGREKLGFVNRKDGARFVPVVALTDEQRDRIVEEINAARAAEGKFGPLSGAGVRPSITAPVRKALDEIHSQPEDDGDE